MRLASIRCVLSGPAWVAGMFGPTLPRTGEMLLTMRSVLRNLNPAMAGAVTAMAVNPGRRVGRSARWRSWAASAVVATLVVLQFVPSTTRAQGQVSDSGGQSNQNSAPIQITPAPSNPSNSAPLEPIFPTPAGSATAAPRMSRGTTPVGPASGGGLGFGPIQPGDIVEVQIFDAPEYSVSMPVSPAGLIAIPYAGLFHIEGMTSIEASKAIARLFVQNQILRDPHVIVTTQQFGYSVTVMGEVKSPGIYSLAGKKRLIDMLTEAGGVTDRAGHVVEIFASGSMKDPQTVLWDPTLRENDNAELQIKTGETILVSRCGVVYVGGNVNRPGAYPLCESNHTTLSQVIALAQGTKPASWSQRTLLLRTSGSGTRVVQKIKLEDALRGRQVDIIMQPDDIVFIPPSILKATSKVALMSAIGFATQAYFYVH
jgi:polysaccharide export outer membrane protein